MMSGSPPWKPQATLTLVASSIISASWPISQGPKLSPRSQLRSMVFISTASRSGLVIGSCHLVLASARLPRIGVDGADGSAGDIRILQRFDVEFKVFDLAEPLGQGAQQFGELLRLGLRLLHADRLETERRSGRRLRETADIGRNDGRDLGIAASGIAVGHQHDRRAVAGHLDAAIDGAVGDDVVAVRVLDDGTFEAIAHAVAGRRNLPLAVEKQGLGFIGKFIVLRSEYHADRA